MHDVQPSYSLARVRWSAVKVYLLAGYRMALAPCQGIRQTSNGQRPTAKMIKEVSLTNLVLSQNYTASSNHLNP